MKKPLTEEKAAGLLEEILKRIEGMDSIPFYQSLQNMISLLGTGKLGAKGVNLFHQILGIIRKSGRKISKNEKESCLHSVLREAEKAGLGEEELFSLMEEVGKMGSVGKEVAQFSMLRIVLPSEPPQEAIEELRSMARKTLNRLKGAKTLMQGWLHEAFSTANLLRSWGREEDFWEIMETLVDAFPKVRRRDRMLFVFDIVFSLQDSPDEERTKVILGKLLDHIQKSDVFWSEGLLELITRKIASFNLRDPSPIFSRIWEMAKEMGGGIEILLKHIELMIKAGAERSLIEKALKECRELAGENPFLYLLEVLLRIRTLCEVGEFETALDRAKKIETLYPDVLSLVADCIVRSL